MASLPYLPWEQASIRWATIIEKFLNNPPNSPVILKEIPLVIGDNSINHKLGHKLTGWKIIRQRGPAAIYDAQDDNQQPQLTLVLVSDAIVSIDLEVY